MPVKNPEYVFEYLGRYPHRVAISNDRITAFENGRGTISYKDRDADKSAQITSDGRNKQVCPNQAAMVTHWPKTPCRSTLDRGYLVLMSDTS